MTPTHALVLGIDPGPQKTAAALIAVPRKQTGPNILVTWQYTHSDPRHIKAILERQVDMVVVEQVYLLPGRTSNALRDTCEVGGGIAWLAELLGHNVLKLGVAQWRKRLLGGRGVGNDKMVQLALDAHFPDLPKSNVHLRDALGIALAGSLHSKLRAML